MLSTEESSPIGLTASAPAQVADVVSVRADQRQDDSSGDPEFGGLGPNPEEYGEISMARRFWGALVILELGIW